MKLKKKDTKDRVISFQLSYELNQEEMERVAGAGCGKSCHLTGNGGSNGGFIDYNYD